MSYAPAISPATTSTRGIEQIHRRGEDFADVSAAVTDQPPRFGIPAVGQFHDVAHMADSAALLLQRAHQCPATRDRLQAAGVTASAWHTGRGRSLVVAEFASRLDGTAL